jgi:two-component system alkaline phosphatase synthesis response regulator PhoP
MSTIPVSAHGKCVFVVDDEPNLANLLSLILQRVGFVVRTFYDGLSAFEHAQQEPPDIVISDVVMPRMDGLTLAAKLREHFPHCGILLASGNACFEDLLSDWRRRVGADVEILAKPVQPEVIIRKLAALADNPGSSQA